MFGNTSGYRDGLLAIQPNWRTAASQSAPKTDTSHHCLELSDPIYLQLQFDGWPQTPEELELDDSLTTT
jgi:hypothetical protein